MRMPTNDEITFAEEQVRIVLEGLRRNAAGTLDAVIGENGSADWTQIKGLQVHGDGTVALFARGKGYISQVEHPGREAGDDMQFAFSLYMVRLNWLVAKQGRNIMFFDPSASWAGGTPPPFLAGCEG